MSNSGKSAKEQRETLLKGDIGELLAMDFFDDQYIPYIHSTQNTHTFSKYLANNHMSRPDFLAWNPKNPQAMRFFDTKNCDVFVKDMTIHLTRYEVTRLQNTQKSTKIPVIVAFVIDKKFLNFVRLSDLVDTGLGYDFIVNVQPGTVTTPTAFTPMYEITQRLCAWDSTAGKTTGINKTFSIDSLFED